MEIKKKLCKYCGNLCLENAFGVALTTKKKVYRRHKCRDCYRATKQILVQRYFTWINEYKIQKRCMRCHISDPRVLDFHHRDEKDKLFSVGEFRWAVGFDRIKKEIEKCDVVCANCHRILHDEARNNSTKNGA